MNNHDHYLTANSAWIDALSGIISDGEIVSPRGIDTYELLNKQFFISMLYPVLYVPERKLSYKFLAGEALWILDGDNTVEGIAPYNSKIAEFSDDGKTFFGAYGPKIQSQWEYALSSLVFDSTTRQAVISLWRESPPKTKDCPCTSILQFLIRDGELHLSVYMRSSDAWLGLPYDMFNFSMVALRMTCHYNNHMAEAKQVSPGVLTITMGSSHLYKKDIDSAIECIEKFDILKEHPQMPFDKYVVFDPYYLALKACRDNQLDDFWAIRP